MSHFYRKCSPQCYTDCIVIVPFSELLERHTNFNSSVVVEFEELPWKPVFAIRYSQPMQQTLTSSFFL